MVTILQFIKEELNDHVRNVILRCIEQGRLNGKVKEELVFNKYSLEFSFQEDSMIIYDDVFSEDLPLNVKIEEFICAINAL
jgi:hypothetical protein